MHPAEQKVHDDVRDHGWHVIKLDDEQGAFSYTIGLHRTFGHPEVIVYGLPGDVAHRVLNLVGDEVRAGRVMSPGSVSGEILEGYDVTFREFPRAAYADHLGWATWFYGGPAFPALQLVYPDRNGRYPWDEGVSPGFAAEQPVLADRVSRAVLPRALSRLWHSLRGQKADR